MLTVCYCIGLPTRENCGGSSRGHVMSFRWVVGYDWSFKEFYDSCQGDRPGEGDE